MSMIRILSVGLLVTSAARAQVTPSVDLLSPGEPGYDALPANIAVVDCFIDVAASDLWTGANLRITTENTATLIYARDGNGEILFVSPGLENQYTTFVSRPYGRDAAARFTNGGVAAGANPDPLPTGLNVGWFLSPPDTSWSGVDGYVARVAIELGDFAPRRDFLQLSTSPPDPSAQVLARSETVGGPGGWWNVTFDDPSPDGINWYVFDPVPEPASILIFILGGLALRRK